MVVVLGLDRTGVEGRPAAPASVCVPTFQLQLPPKADPGGREQGIGFLGIRECSGGLGRAPSPLPLPLLPPHPLTNSLSLPLK